MGNLSFLTRRSRGGNFGKKTIVDLRPWLTAQALAPLAVTAEEKEYARNAMRLADHAVDQAFASALRQASLQARTLTPTGKALELAQEVVQLQDLIKEDQAQVNSITAQLSAQAKGSSPTVDNGDLEIAKAQKFDVVLLDVMMPGKSGWEVARALKQDPVTQDIKIVMVTAIGEQVNEITSPLYGADAYIDKPFEFERLEKVIKGLVTSR